LQSQPYGCSGSSRTSCRALASGGAERGVFTAHPRGVSSAKAKVLYVPLVHGLRDVDRPVVGSAKIPRILNERGRTVCCSRVTFGRRGRLSRRPGNQDHAENGECYFSHLSLRGWTPNRSNFASPVCVLHPDKNIVGECSSPIEQKSSRFMLGVRSPNS